MTGYSIADNPQQATKQTAKAVFSMGYDVEEIIPKALHIPLSGWGDFIASAWPDFRDHFPTQAAIGERLANSGVVFSPFAGFDRESTTR